MERKTEFRRSFSAYCFALIITVLICSLLWGIVYIDLCASDTILSADGLISPWLERIVDAAERYLRNN